ncbi:kinase-like protein [Penicillium psychrosexuale]|uniref:kinase-like protein n=1 Tax=Penicillium psychrosexuale TaxID=1002107 RepID=UPI002544DB8E|nr:kinase-like protein [Penicillium psychrosexuale]KAJ5799716.1 kinase-like protein [Penicillium psychrosexuale]
MSALFHLGQSLKGKVTSYTIIKHVQDCVWLARSQIGQIVVIKSVRHFRLGNERDVLKKFQSCSPFLRPLLDEIIEPRDPPAIVLKHLDDHLLSAAAIKSLNKVEIKYVARRVLQALNVLHLDGFVHTDVKPDNILVNYGTEVEGVRFTDVQLADFGSTVPATSKYATDSDLIGAPIWRSPEAHLRIGWGTLTDIWSFGTILITLIYGDNYFMFKPDVPADHDEYEHRILTRQCQFFGPFPISYQEIAPPSTLSMLMQVMSSLHGKQMPFTHISTKEVSVEDKKFILKIMKLDPRDRPSAQQLLDDEWFNST